MSDALIGYSGFVGSSLLKQRSFDELYRSTNISDIQGRVFDTVVCAGAPAQKWIANREPEIDRSKILSLIEHLRSIRCKRFILISTVDVFKNPVKVDEHTDVNEVDLHAYGLNRRLLEKFVEDFFPEHLIVRLPGLVGPGLRKNVIFDLLNNNNVANIDSSSVFQFYPVVNLWYDIQLALDNGLKLVHFTAEPISVEQVSERCFAKSLSQNVATTGALYDMRTRYADVFGAIGLYQYSLRETVQAVRGYVQSEPKSQFTQDK